MKKNLIIIALLFFLYIILINTFNYFSSYYQPIQNQIIQKQITGVGIEVAHVSTSLAVSVQRKRWYGKIYEIIDGQGKISNLYLLGFIKLPLVNAGINYITFHILFFILILIYISIIITIKLIKYKKHKYYYI